MSATRFRERLDILQWSQHGLADYLGVAFSAVQRWANGANPVPAHVAAWLEEITAPLEAHPLPEGWDQSRK